MINMPHNTMHCTGDLGPNGHDDDVMTMGGDGDDDDANDDSVSLWR